MALEVTLMCELCLHFHGLVISFFVLSLRLIDLPRAIVGA